jgi:hypothetical protein
LNILFAQNAASDSLRFPISDRRSDRFTTANHNPFDLSMIRLLTNTILRKKLEMQPTGNQPI